MHKIHANVMQKDYSRLDLSWSFQTQKKFSPKIFTIDLSSSGRHFLHNLKRRSEFVT